MADDRRRPELRSDHPARRRRPNRYGRTVASEPVELAPAGADPARATRELGDVQAKDWPVLVRGSVVDDGDHPLERAPVELCDAAGRPDPRTRVISDERGQFVLRGPPPAADAQSDALLVRALEPDRQQTDATVALRRGDQRARIVVTAHGRLEGRVLLPENAPPGNAVTVRVHQATGSAMALTVTENDTFAFSVVESGPVRITFAPQGFEEPVLVLDDVIVPHGGPSVDPRLSSIDLRQVLSVVELEVVGPDGSPVATAWAGPVGEERPNGRPYDFADGIARVVVARNPPPLRIWAEGCEPFVVRSPAGRVRVQLKPLGG